MNSPAEWSASVCRVRRRALSHALGWYVLATAAAWWQAGAVGQQPVLSEGQPANRVSLPQLLEDYFRTDQPSQREALAEQINVVAEGRVPPVAEALRELQLWSEPTAPSETFVFRGPRGAAVARWNVPRGYSPTTAQALIIEVSRRRLPRGAGEPGLLELLPANNPPFPEGCVRVLVEPEALDTTHNPLQVGEYLRPLLCELRRRLHLDSNRTFLLSGAPHDPAPWAATLANVDLLAGFATYGASPEIPYPAQALPLLLANVGNLPGLLAWSRAEPAELAHGRAGESAVYAPYIVSLAERKSLPLVGVEVSAADGEQRFAAEMTRLLALRRGPVPRELSYWFRYPEQGRIWWLQQRKHAGEAWEEDQLSIVVMPPLDRDQYITDVLGDQLAYLGGRIEGQTITIEARRCEEIDVLFYEGMVDFAQPVIVRCNGKTRHRELIKPSIRTLLAETAADWDFQRPVWAKLTLTIHE